MKLLTLALLTICLVGCSSVSFQNEKVTFKASVPFWSNSTLKGLAVDSTTKSGTSTGLRITSSNIDPNIESITATSDALGGLIGAAAASMAKGAVKP